MVFVMDHLTMSAKSTMYGTQNGCRTMTKSYPSMQERNNFSSLLNEAALDILFSKFMQLF